MRPTTGPQAQSKRSACSEPQPAAAPAARSAWDWAAAQFGAARLGDERLTRRLVRVAATCAQRPGDSLPQATGNWAATKGAYRLIENPRVHAEAILHSACQATARRCHERETILALQDTTTLTFPTARAAAADLGYVSDLDLPALEMHSTLAVRENGVALGLLDVQIWARDRAERGKARLRKKRPFEEKESAKWYRGIVAAEKILAEAAPPEQRPRCIHVMDREGDIHEVFAALDERPDCGAVIRAKHNRRIGGEQAGDFERANALVRRQAVVATRIVNVSRKGNRPARQAAVAVRCVEVELAPRDPYNPRRQPLTLWLVEALEQDPPPGAEPLCWRLWTTEPTRTRDEALRIVAIYEMRWKIEDFHKILKSGCRVEDLRLHTGERIIKVLAIYAPVAARILELRDLARLQPRAPCTEALSEIEWRALWVAIHKTPPAPSARPPTIRQAVLWIGRLGGHLGRKGDGMPGIVTLWRGLRDLELLCDIYQSLQPHLNFPDNP